jgi:hypothetical protein
MMRSLLAGHQLLPKGLELESLSVEAGHVSIWAGSRARRCIVAMCAPSPICPGMGSA